MIKVNKKYIRMCVLLIIIFIMIAPLLRVEAALTTYTNHEINIKIDSNGCNITGYGWYWVKDSEYEWDSDTNDYHSGKRTSSSDGGPVWTQDAIRIDNVAFKFKGNVKNYTPFVWVKATAPTGYIYTGIQVTEQGSSSAQDLSVKSYNGGYITDVGCYKGDWANQNKDDREYREANSTVTFTVKKTPITYTVQYVGNGHTGGTTSNSTHTYDSSKNLTYNGFTKTGYSFKCWNTKADGTGTSYINGQSVKNLATTNGSTVQLFAQWEKNTYTMNIEYDNGVDGSSIVGAGSYVYGTKIDIFAKPKTGYHLVSILDKDSGTVWDSTNSTNGNMFLGWNIIFDRHLYINSAPNTYYIKYDSNKPSGASNKVVGSMTNSEHTYNSNKQLEDNKYSIIGWHFTGWNTKADGSGKSYSNQEEVINLTSVDKATITLYAQWKANVYTITYDKNKPSNATASVVGTTATSNHTYDISSKLTVNNYSLIGWRFIGWNTKADGSGTNYTDNQEVINLVAANNGNITLYAQWKANTYIITYKGNGATSGSMSNSTHTYDTSSKLSNNKFTKSTYNFTGWNTKPDGSGTSYSDQQSVKNLTATDKATITLYAQWSKPLTLTFSLNGGIYNESNQSIVLSGTVYNNQTEYTFNFNGTATPAKKYIYSAQTNTIQAYGTVTSNGLNNLLTKRDIDGTLYRFLGWSTDKTATVPQEPFNTYNDSHNLTYTINTSTTLYAIWEPVLIVQLKSERVLGSLASLVDIPKSTVMASYKTNVANINGSIVTTARPGESIRYTAQHRGNLDSLQVTFDQYITNMYDYKNTVYTDTLNQITVENAGEVIPSSGYTEANSSLNRLIQNPLSQITRLYSLPLYLGSERAKEASHQATRYYVDYTFTNSNSFYYQYTQDKPEVITIRQIIILSTNENGYTDSILEELKTKLKIRLR